MPLPIAALYDLAQATLDAVVAGWPAEATPLPERQYISDGAMVWDGCEFLTVLVDATFGTEGDVSIETIIQMGMGFTLRAALIGVGIFRCVPTVDDEGAAPDPSEIDSSAHVVLTDAIALFNVLAGAQQAGRIATCNGLAFERWSGQPPQGGMGGGVLTFRAMLL